MLKDFLIGYNLFETLLMCAGCGIRKCYHTCRI